LIYLAGDGVHLYYNQSGNRWSDRDLLPFFPPIDNLASIQVVDLLGNGTACLVWSSPLPNDSASPMRYIDLMDGQKPHLLVGLKNNLGAETRIYYAPSTKFYLADQANLTPWVTRLPFPVHVVEQVETYDQISRNRFASRYLYHHGYFDGEEREFRGFGMVEQLDTEEFAALNQSDAFPTGDNIDAASHIPPMLTKSWFHNGTFLQRWRVSQHYEDEYYREPGLSSDVPDPMLLPDTLLPEGLSSEEQRQACRALKGSTLRQEIYALDGSEAAGRPYRVSERNFTVKLLQPLAENQHAVFFVHDRETLDFHYERKLFPIGSEQLADPRVSHALTLAVDDFGNVLRSAAIGYGRRYDATDESLTAEERQKQRQLLATYTENGYTNAIEEDDAYRASLPCESQTFQLYHTAPTSNQPGITNLFRFEEIQEQIERAGDGNHDLPYRDLAGSEARQNQPHRRAIEHIRTLYRADDMGRAGGGNQTLLPLGELESLALPGESYRLALTPALLDEVYQRNGANLLPNPVPILRDEGGYVRSNDLKADGRFPARDRNNQWWIPSGRVYFSRNENDAPTQELDQARQHFFMPVRFRDPFDEDTRILYDGFDLLHLESQDPLENRITVGERRPNGTIQNRNNYRVLQPELTTDPNGNRSAVAFDALGMVVGTAVMGKRNQTLGDSLAGFRADLNQDEIDIFFANPKANISAQLLGNATTRSIYDETRFLRQGAEHPTYAATIARETHASDPVPAGGLQIQVSISYSDGFGRAIQQKIQAEPGPVAQGGQRVNPRWVGSGWTIFNNKGNPVKQYEPFFDDTHEFRFGHEVGVSPTLFYDPADRVVATLHPNHTWEKVVFDPWQQVTWDVNDTVLIDAPQNDADVGDYFARLPDAEYLPTWHAQRRGGALGNAERDAANKTAAHANTPTTVYFDALGRPMLAVAHNGPDGLYATRTELDIEGNELAVRDAQDRIVMHYDYDMLGNRIHQASMEAGERWNLNDATGNAIRGWDSRGFIRRMTYDELRRPINLFVADGQGERLTERTVYGERQGDANNHRGQVYQVFDSAGVGTNERYDFKGNLLTSSRQFTVDYKVLPNWSGSPALAGETFISSTVYDALNRPVTLTTPDNSVIRPTYNEANLLEQVTANLRGANAATTFVANIDYDAKGQRQSIDYGNGIQTRYTYDPLTFRLTQMRTRRSNVDLQNLQYTYDPTGNITTLRDDAQQTIYFNNNVVAPHSDYTYDAIYRLIAADGREHIGQAGQPQSSWNDEFRTNLPHPTAGGAMRRYTEQYEYDEVGNILQLIHRANNGNWTRRYAYNEASQLEPEQTSNRLSSTTVGNDTAHYPHDIHGNMTAMPHLAQMEWDYKDQLQQVDLGGGGTAYYVYDAGGQRVRKVIERQNGNRQEERLYLGGFEVFRSYAGNGNTVALARETLHVMDDTRRIALVETRTQGNDGSPRQLSRYQLGNHLDSASLELDEAGQVISYEEYHPYGSTAYQAVRG
ncbi:MAG: hypothetical protein KDE31_07300, partial [Caldilineaceae bacterium]|nr:hypothetical protein [Caldilineaceae bacterium]